jgi:hypothetical protein
MKTVLAAVAMGLMSLAPIASADCPGHDKEAMASSAPTDKLAATPAPSAATTPAKVVKPIDIKAQKRPVTAKAQTTEGKVVAATSTN